MSQIIYEGSIIRFYTKTPFTSIAGTVIDPDQVTFAYQVAGQNPVSFIYINGTGDSTGTIVRDAVGTYHADIDTTGLHGPWVITWRATPTALHADSTRTKVVTENSITVANQSISL